MNNDFNLQFIREKISQLRNAIMYNNSQEVMKVRNNIIDAIDIDEQGQLWFTATKPTAQLAECEQCFPARLHFYRKGVLFYLEISGKATVVEYSYPQHGNDRVLMKMSLNTIEYTDLQSDADRVKGFFERRFSSACNWLMRTISIGERPQTETILPKMQ